MSVISTGNISRSLELGIKNHFGETYDQHETQYTMLFDSDTSSRAFELDQQFEGLSLAAEKKEGDGIAYDSQREGITPKYINLTYAKGIILTMEAIADQQYNLFSRKAQGLAFAMTQTKETVGANVYNRGFNSSFIMPDGDGESLFSTAHVNGPTDGGTFSNKLAVAAALSNTSLKDLLIQISKATDSRNLQIAIRGEKLIVAPEEGFNAETILNSQLQSDTAENAINSIRSRGMVPGGFAVNNYLTSDKAWFIRTNAPDGIKYFTREKVMFDQDQGFNTKDTFFSAIERYSFGWSDPRGVYGSEGV